MIDPYLENYFSNTKSTPLFQFIVAFSFGILFSPFSKGLIYTILTILIMEILTFMYCNTWSVLNRILIIIGSLSGYAIGRFISGNPILKLI